MINHKNYFLIMEMIVINNILIADVTIIIKIFKIRYL
jgi:hypothetical protein